MCSRRTYRRRNLFDVMAFGFETRVSVLRCISSVYLQLDSSLPLCFPLCSIYGLCKGHDEMGAELSEFSVDFGRPHRS